jgi:hypothetical protein
MEIKNIIIHFPWGAGGNLIRNCLILDNRFEFDENTADTERYQYLYNYYQTPVTSKTWLDREWQFRGKLYGKYYEHPGVITYWNPYKSLVYLSHDAQFEINSIMSGEFLKTNKFYNSLQKISHWTLLDCEHIFLIPTDWKRISEVYISKYKKDSAFTDTIEERINKCYLDNKFIIETQIEISNRLSNLHKSVLIYDPSQLFTPNGFEMIMTIIDQLKLSVSKNQVKTLHQTWLQQTKQIYFEFYEKSWE